MAKMAILFCQVAAVAASASDSNMAMRIYSDSACSSGALQTETIVTQESMLAMLGAAFGGASLSMGACANGTVSTVGAANYGVKASYKPICNQAGFFVVNVYALSDTCEEANLASASTTVRDCLQEDPSKSRWTSWPCDVDVNGYAKYHMKTYSTSDCSGSFDAEMDMFMKMDHCKMDSVWDGQWITKTMKMARSGDVITAEEFLSDDCSGAVNDTTTLTCVGCSEIDSGLYSAIIDCPAAGGGVGDAGEAFQLSSGMAALMLLALQALRA